MRTGCQGQELSPISSSIQSSFGQWRAQDRCTCRCSWRRRSTKNCGVRTGERTGRSAKIRSGWVCWHRTSPRWRCPTWWEFWATSRLWTRPRWRRRSAPRWLSKLNLEYSNECGLVLICSDCQAQDRSWDGEPGEKIDSCSEEGEEREEAEGGCHLRHQCGRLQVTKPNKSENIRASIFIPTRVKDLRNPAKKWKLEKNAQQLFMTGTVLLYQVGTFSDFFSHKIDWFR